MSTSSRRRSTRQSAQPDAPSHPQQHHDTSSRPSRASSSSRSTPGPTVTAAAELSDDWSSGGDAEAASAYLAEGAATMADAATIAIEEATGAALGGWHYAPLFIALAPAAGALLGGRADAWSDAILLLLASFWLYQFLKVPHEVYRAARTKRVLHADAMDTDGRKDEREAAAAELRRAETLALISCMFTPIAGAWVLSWLMDNLTDGNRYLNTFNIRLFMLAAGIKPWTHAFSLLRRRLLHLHEIVHYPSSRVETLNRRVGSMENELSQLRRLVALKTDVRLLRDGIDVPLTQLSRTMRRFEKKEEHLRLSAEDKFNLMESRLEDLLREVAINAELIEEERRERERVASLPVSMFQAIKFALGSRASSQESQHKRYLYDAPRSLPSTASLGITGPNAEGGASCPTYGSKSQPPSYGQGSPPRYSGTQQQRQQEQRGAQSPTTNQQYPADVKEAASSWTSSGPGWLLFGMPNAALRFANEKVRGTVSAAANQATYPSYAQQQQQQPGSVAQTQPGTTGSATTSSRGNKMHSTAQRRLAA